jgi:hypothetical protein
MTEGLFNETTVLKNFSDILSFRELSDHGTRVFHCKSNLNVF